ncbi:hypothetical protein ACQX4X_10915 [Corynebacterium diphtheriae]
MLDLFLVQLRKWLDFWAPRFALVGTVEPFFVLVELLPRLNDVCGDTEFGC